MIILRVTQEGVRAYKTIDDLTPYDAGGLSS